LVLFRPFCSRIRSFGPVCIYTRICCDGWGRHLLDKNNVCDNGRGSVSMSAVDTTLRDDDAADK